MIDQQINVSFLVICAEEQTKIRPKEIFETEEHKHTNNHELI